jgi:glycosyltransferase involved in cell wall biosynthesis
MSKKILMISQNFYPEIGSAGNRIKNIYVLLQKRGYEVDILTTDPTYPNRKLYEDSNFWNDDSLNNDVGHIKRIRVKNKKYSRSILNRLFYYLEITIRMIVYVLTHREKYDVVFVTSPPIFIAIVGLLAKVRYKSKLILDIRDLWPESLKGVGVFNYPFIIKAFKKVEHLLYKRANDIIVNSRGFIDYIESYSKVGREKITFIPNGINDDEIRKKDLPKRSFRVIYAGNIGLAQDNELLMEMAKELNKSNISLTIMAYGMKREQFVKFAKHENLSNIDFVKPRTREESFKLIMNHDVGIVTLNDEDVFETVLPGKLIDYMSCGIPIVAAVSGYSKEIIETQNVGYVSEDRNAVELVKFILNLIHNQDLSRELSLNGINYVMKNFSWDRNIQLLINVIESSYVAPSTIKNTIKDKG